MNCDAAADPDAFVPTSTAFDPLAENVPLGPLPGAAKSTAIPAIGVVIGQPFVLITVTSSGFENGVRSLALCGVPPARLSAFGGL